MLEVSAALKLIKQHTPGPEIISAPIDSSLVGYVLAEDVTAPEPVPAYRASIVDGYALIAPTDETSSAGVFSVAGISHAAPGRNPPLQAGTIARITTGAPLPDGATAVVMVEETTIAEYSEDGTEEREVEILASNVKPGENIREIGSDIAADSVILKKGDRISASGGELGLLASVGRASVKVYRRPTVAVLSTGDEIVNHSQPGSLVSGQVRDCNRPVLLSLLSSWGIPTLDLGISSDTPGALEEMLRAALRKADVVITSGGVSMGELDLLKPTIERSLGGTIHFGRVNMKPGKPTTFATVPIKMETGEVRQKVIFALPGNPASAIVTANLFVLPSVHHVMGIEPAGLYEVSVTLAHDVRCDPQRPEYHRAVVGVDNAGRLLAASTGKQRSSMVGSLKSANALLVLPAGNNVRKGEVVQALIMGPIGSAQQ
jgi:gephyrin